MKIFRLILAGIVCVLLPLTGSSHALDVSAADGVSEPSQSEAPINPAFSRSIQRGKVAGKTVSDVDSPATGLMPSPVDRSHLKGKKIKTTQLAVSSPPPSYDLRTLQQVTPVRDQKNCNVCWAFAGVGSLESNLLRIDPATQSNLSENNMKNLLSSSDPLGYDRAYCDGGNSDMATAYLARWNGPVNESEDPYNTASGASPASLSVKKHVQEVLILPDRSGPLDNDMIKQQVMQYGGVYTSLYMDTDYSYKTSTFALYYNGSADSDHAVVIIGWDDNYSSSNFLSPPAGNGAFIVRNSWGINWGQAGYFYVSYYDSNIGTSNAVFVNAESPANFSRVYQYDPLGVTSGTGFNNTTAWFANVFTAVATESLAAVSFHTNDLNCSYEVRAYSGVSGGPTSGTSIVATVSGILPLPGYHTIALPTSNVLVAGQKFSVVVKVTTSGDIYPITVEKPYAGYSSKATASAGQSYISSNGTTWTDATSGSANRNVCLKAFTIPATDITPPIVTAFVMPAAAATLNVPVTTLTATDGVGVTGYLVTESPTAPAAAAAGWSAAAPAGFTFSSAGSKTAYAWARDAVGNVSASSSAVVSITQDTTAPVVSAFSIPAISSSRTVLVSSFTASDNVAVTGYLLTESSAVPSAVAPGWTIAPPASYTFLSADSTVLYAWAKDAAGNVSVAKSAPITITTAVAGGDVDGNGIIDISDALRVLRFVVGAGTLTAAQAARADVAPLGSNGKPLGGDGIDISDAILIMDRSVGLVSW